MSNDFVKRLRICAAFDPDQAEAADLIEKLEAALREIAFARPECCAITNAMQGIARKALDAK